MNVSMHKNRGKGQSDIMASRWHATSRRLIILVLTVLSIAVFAPTTFASGPNSGPQGKAHGSKTQQDAQWLKAKLSYRVSSGIIPGQGKGAHTHPSVLSTPFFNPSVKGGSLAPDTGTPSSYTLGTAPQYVGEPSDGQHVNFPESNWQFTYDDAQHHYSDGYMYTLCGPGAADVTTDYWPVPPNTANYANVSDGLYPTQYTNWNGADVDGTTRMRGYMVHMAFQIEPPTWATPGMLPQSYFQSGELGGATLQVVRDTLNWEASGHSSVWASYFYINTWNSSFTSESAAESSLHTAIVNDLYYNNVPVIVELKAGYLPNWSSSNMVYHFVTIVGYNDSTGQYTHVDTCKHFTGCNGTGGVDTPDFHPVGQHQLALGVYSISTNTTTGDGGWVW